MPRRAVRQCQGYLLFLFRKSHKIRSMLDLTAMTWCTVYGSILLEIGRVHFVRIGTNSSESRMACIRTYSSPSARLSAIAMFVCLRSMQVAIPARTRMSLSTNSIPLCVPLSLNGQSTALLYDMPCETGP